MRDRAAVDLGSNYGLCWRVVDSEGNKGALVEEDYAKPYWWVLCPATTTLILDPPTKADDKRGGNCSDAGCMFDEVHRLAHNIIRHRAVSASAESDAIPSAESVTLVPKSSLTEDA